MYVNGQIYNSEGLSAVKATEDGKLLLHAFALNNDAVEDGIKKYKGDSTEIALMEMANEHNVKAGSWPRLAEIAFDADGN